IQDKAADEDAKKRKRTETESLGGTTKGSAKKQQLEKKRKEPLKKRKWVEKPKNKAEERTKMDKKRKKKLEEPQDKKVKKKKIKREFKSLRAKTTVKPLYEETKTLTPKRKTKIREIGFGTLLDFPFEKIPEKLPCFIVKILDKKMKVTFPSESKIKITPKKIRKVLGIPMGKKKLESDSPREYDDEFLKAFKAQFHDKNDFDRCKLIWDHIQTSKNTWDDIPLEKWYYGPNTVLMLIYLHYTKIDGQIGLVEVIEDDDKKDENEKDAEKRKLREVNYL
nr:hypothetical protein [Tanacetum cinerariifolium]